MPIVEPDVRNSNLITEDASIYLRTISKRGLPYDWYVIGNDASLEEPGGKVDDPISIEPQPNRYHHNNSTCVASGTIIYVLGGVDVDFQHSRPQLLGNVYYFDIRHPDGGWKEGPSMLKPRSGPYAASIDGKIYVIGSKEPLSFNPWAEVYDKEEENWQALPCSVGEIPSVANGHAVLDGGKRLLVHAPASRELYSYNVEDGSWELYTTGFGRFRCQPAFLDGVMYLCDFDEPGIVYAYDVTKRESSPKPLMGLEAFLHGIILHGVVAVGIDRLCVIWTKRVPGRNSHLRVFCLKFSVSKEKNALGEVEFVANTPLTSDYYLPRVNALADFLAIFPRGREIEKGVCLNTSINMNSCCDLDNKGNSSSTTTTTINNSSSDLDKEEEKNNNNNKKKKKKKKKKKGRMVT